MFNFDKVDLQRVAVSSVGAIALSAACILGVAGPAHAGTVDQWKSAVEQQLDAATPAAIVNEAKRPAETDLAVRIDANGRYVGASILRSSGDKMLDQGALLAARRTRYQPLPAGYSSVTMRILHDASATTVAAARLQDPKTAQYAANGTVGFKALAK